MKKTTLLLATILAFGCQNNTKTKNIDESNYSDKKCSELLERANLLESKLDLVDSEISDLQAGLGKFENNVCSVGRHCSEHGKIYLKRDSLFKAKQSVDIEFQKEVKNSSKDFRLKYYSDLSNKLHIRLDTAKAHKTYLESGTRGYSKCSIGATCPRHREIYETVEQNQKELDSINEIIKNLK